MPRIEETVIEPADLGLPEKFAAFRSGQWSAVMATAEDACRFTLMSSPAGSGKSTIALSLAQLMDVRTLILTGTKGLQLQYAHDFGVMGLTDIRGQNNYLCAAMAEGGEFYDEKHKRTSLPTCDDGPCHSGLDCTLRDCGCSYYDAVRRAANARLVITNYQYWMTTNRYSDPENLGKFGLIVLDEAHSAPELLADFCAIRMSRSEVRSLLNAKLPPIDEHTETWAEWAAEQLPLARNLYVTWRDALKFERNASVRRDMSDKVRRITRLGRDLRELAKAHEWRRSEPTAPSVWVPGSDTDWIAEQTPEGAMFSPVWAHAYAEDYLFRGIPRVVLMSATLQPPVGRYLGIAPVVGASVFREYASTFDVKRRPFTYVPTTTVDRHMTEGQVRIWVNKIDALIEDRRKLGWRGIIHTRSYDRARIIAERSKHRDIMLTHTTRTSRDVIAHFKRGVGTGPAVLVSPSVEEGYDFPHDECRYQILAKVPLIDTRSPVIQARCKSDKAYRNYLTAQSVMQQVGRGMRAESDWCETFIIDDHWSWLSTAAIRARQFPKWFIAAMRTHSGGGVPAPMSPPW